MMEQVEALKGTLEQQLATSSDELKSDYHGRQVPATVNSTVAHARARSLSPPLPSSILPTFAILHHPPCVTIPPPPLPRNRFEEHEGRLTKALDEIVATMTSKHEGHEAQLAAVERDMHSQHEERLQTAVEAQQTVVQGHYDEHQSQLRLVVRWPCYI